MSYRNLEEMLLEQGVEFDHTTNYRWVQTYGPELDPRCRPDLRPTKNSWRVDETYIEVKGKWKYLSPYGIDQCACLHPLSRAVRYLPPRRTRSQTSILQMRFVPNMDTTGLVALEDIGVARARSL